MMSRRLRCGNLLIRSLGCHRSETAQTGRVALTVPELSNGLHTVIRQRKMLAETRSSLDVRSEVHAVYRGYGAGIGSYCQ